MKNEPVCPKGSNVVVKPDVLGETTEGGLIIPDVARDNERMVCTTGDLVAMGPATDLSFYRNGEITQVKQDMLPCRVLFVRYGGTSLTVGGRRNGTNYRVMTEDDIIAFLFEDVDAARGV